MNPQDDGPAAANCELPQLERLSRRLIQHAARNSPATLADRLEEEWLAHLAAQRGALSRLRFAIGCCWAMRVIAHDYLASGAAASSAATGHGTVVLGHYDLAFFSRRTTILFLIVALHAFVIYGFATGFGQKGREVLPGSMRTTILNPPEILPALPPLIGSRPLNPTRIVPEMPPTFRFPQDDAISDTNAPPPPLHSSPPQEPTHTVNRILGGPGAGFPNTDDFYPPASVRGGEMGATTVKVCIDERGRLASAPMIARSSGNTRLDDAALRVAKAGSGHYRSTTEDGRPVPSCLPFRVRFQLKQ
jgi:TonB family protein